jgi:hypothetical protein
LGAALKFAAALRNEGQPPEQLDRRRATRRRPHSQRSAPHSEQRNHRNNNNNNSNNSNAHTATHTSIDSRRNTSEMAMGMRQKGSTIAWTADLFALLSLFSLPRLLLLLIAAAAFFVAAVAVAVVSGCFRLCPLAFPFLFCRELSDSRWASSQSSAAEASRAEPSVAQR